MPKTRIYCYDGALLAEVPPGDALAFVSACASLGRAGDFRFVHVVPTAEEKLRAQIEALKAANEALKAKVAPTVRKARG